MSHFEIQTWTTRVHTREVSRSDKKIVLPHVFILIDHHTISIMSSNYCLLHVKVNCELLYVVC
jgi:hypothetical protein